MGLAPVTVLIMLLWWFGTQFVVIALIVLMSIGVDWAWDRSEARARGSSPVGSLPISEKAKISPAVEHPQPPRRNLGRSDSERAKSDQAMEDQEGHRPADLPCP